MGGTQSSSIPNVPVRDAWEGLRSDAGSVLIDVRTEAELTYVGHPDLSSIGKRLVTIEWQTYPEQRVDPGFVEKLGSVLRQLGAQHNSNLYFICRSGARSSSAARAMSAAGYMKCHNVADGFEGPLDAGRHRGAVAGWKAEGLPWAQG